MFSIGVYNVFPIGRMCSVYLLRESRPREAMRRLHPTPTTHSAPTHRALPAPVCVRGCVCVSARVIHPTPTTHSTLIHTATSACVCVCVRARVRRGRPVKRNLMSVKRDLRWWHSCHGQTLADEDDRSLTQNLRKSEPWYIYCIK